MFRSLRFKKRTLAVTFAVLAVGTLSFVVCGLAEGRGLDHDSHAEANWAPYGGEPLVNAANAMDPSQLIVIRRSDSRRP